MVSSQHVADLHPHWRQAVRAEWTELRDTTARRGHGRSLRARPAVNGTDTCVRGSGHDRQSADSGWVDVSVSLSLPLLFSLKIAKGKTMCKNPSAAWGHGVRRRLLGLELGGGDAARRSVRTYPAAALPSGRAHLLVLQGPSWGATEGLGPWAARGLTPARFPGKRQLPEFLRRPSLPVLRVPSPHGTACNLTPGGCCWWAFTSVFNPQISERDLQIRLGSRVCSPRIPCASGLRVDREPRGSSSVPGGGTCPGGGLDPARGWAEGSDR